MQYKKLQNIKKNVFIRNVIDIGVFLFFCQKTFRIDVNCLNQPSRSCVILLIMITNNKHITNCKK